MKELKNMRIEEYELVCIMANGPDATIKNGRGAVTLLPYSYTFMLRFFLITPFNQRSAPGKSATKSGQYQVIAFF
jgi:hypothetical protein